MGYSLLSWVDTTLPNKKKKSKKYLMIAANHIHVWNVTSQHNAKQIGSFQGHASQTRKMRISEDNAYLISSGQQRFVYVWKCKSLYKKKCDVLENKLRSAEYSLPCDDDVICIDIRAITKRLNDSEMDYMKQLQAEKNTKSKKKKKKEIRDTKTVYYIVACSKSTL